MLVLTAALIPACVVAQASDAAAGLKAYRASHEAAIVRDLSALLAMPNTAADSAGRMASAQAIQRALEQRGVASRLLTAPGSPPAVYGELKAPGGVATKTIVIYAHYDGQPVNPADWTTPPFAPTLRTGVLSDTTHAVAIPESGSVPREWRLYGRSASDDKGTIVAALAALDAVRAVGAQPSVNLKFFFDGGEEAGSPHMRELLEQNAALLSADLWLFCDGPRHVSGRPQIVFGVRGQAGVEVTTYGPARPLHDGHYGNWAPNPAVALVSLLALLRDDNGKILVDHFYDDVAPITAADRAALAALPKPDSALRAELAIARSESANADLATRLLLPALNVRGLASGAVGAAAANAIPVRATASIDFRLVPNETPERIRELVERYLTKHGYTIVHEEPSLDFRRTHAKVVRLDWSPDSYAAFRTDLNLPIAQRVVAIARATLGDPVYRVPILGGSLPMSVFSETLHAPLIVVPIANYDNNQHAANENIRIGNLFDGVDLFARLYWELGR